MAIYHKIRVLSPSGDFLREFTNFRAFSYTKEVNAAGMLTLDVSDTHPVVKTLDDSLDNIVEVWRKDTVGGVDWYCDFRGLFRDEMRSANSDGSTVVRYYCPGPISLLSRVIVAYRGGTEGRTKFTAEHVETIMKTLVTYNATAAGTTADGRIRDVDLTNVQVEADGGLGHAIDYSCEWRNVLDVLQEITRIAPGDFDMVYVGAGVFEFRFYHGQLGADKRNAVKFALQWNNMANPVYQKNKIHERTVAIVGGLGDEEERPVVVRIPSYSNYSPTNNSVEFYVDGRNTEEEGELNAIGDAAIWEVRADSRLDFDVVQTRSLRYGRDYNLGDLVTGYYQGINQVMKIWDVTVSMDGSGQERIDVGLRKD